VWRPRGGKRSIRRALANLTPSERRAPNWPGDGYWEKRSVDFYRSVTSGSLSSDVRLHESTITDHDILTVWVMKDSPERAVLAARSWRDGHHAPWHERYWEWVPAKVTVGD